LNERRAWRLRACTSPGLGRPAVASVPEAGARPPPRGGGQRLQVRDHRL